MEIDHKTKIWVNFREMIAGNCLFAGNRYPEVNKFPGNNTRKFFVRRKSLRKKDPPHHNFSTYRGHIPGKKNDFCEYFLEITTKFGKELWGEYRSDEVPLDEEKYSISKLVLQSL